MTTDWLMRVGCLALVFALASCSGGNGATAVDAGGRDTSVADVPQPEPAAEVAGEAAVADAATDTATGADAQADTGVACVPLTDRAISEAAGTSGRPSLAWAGDGYGVVWPDDRGGVSQIYFARLDRNGAKVGADRPVTSGTAAASASGLPDIAWSGQVFGISFVTEAATPSLAHFARLGADGTLQGTIADAGEGAGISSIVWGGQSFAVAYHAGRGGAGAQPDIFLSRFDASGARVGTELQLTNEPAASFIPSIAWTGSRYGVTFNDGRGGAVNAFLGLVDANGAEIGQEAPLTTGGGGASSIGASSSGFAVTYSNNAGAFLARLDASGTRIGTDAPIGGAPAQLVWNGSRYAFAWSASSGAVFLNTIGESDTDVSASIPVSASNAVAAVNAIALAWNGSGYAVTWSDSVTGTSETHFAIVCPP